MENIPAEFVSYLCQRLEITACLIVGASGFYNQARKLVPRHIRPHFLYYELTEHAHVTHISPCQENKSEPELVSRLAAGLYRYLEPEDPLHTIVILDADIYISEKIPVLLAKQVREMLLRLPFCISIGCDERADYGKAFDKIALSANTPTLSGYTSILGASNDWSIAWIELLGTHFTPRKDQIKALRVAAIIIAYNEGDILEDCLCHLHSQGISTYLIDDESDDRTEEIARSCLEKGILAGYERSGLAEDCERRWAELLTISQTKAQTLNADWIIHHDADEIRESPWIDVSLSEAISIIDQLGYNCIDHTVIEFLFTNHFMANDGENTAPSVIKNLSRFRFPSHVANFNQLKGWKKADWMKTVDGGHKVELRNQAVFPLKFLIKHYPLRSTAHAKNKIFYERCSRFAAERRLSGWHVHYDPFEYFEEIDPWTRRELHLFNHRTFYSEFLIQRLSGCGLDQTDYIDLNLNTSKKIIDKQEDFKARVAQAVGIDLTSLAVLSRKNSSDTLWVTQTNTLLQAIHDLIESRNQALTSNRHLLIRHDELHALLESENKQHAMDIAKLIAKLNLVHSRLQWNRNRLNKSERAKQIWRSLAMKYKKTITSMHKILSRTAAHI